MNMKPAQKSKKSPVSRPDLSIDDTDDRYQLNRCETARGKVTLFDKTLISFSPIWVGGAGAPSYTEHAEHNCCVWLWLGSGTVN